MADIISIRGKPALLQELGSPRVAAAEAAAAAAMLVLQHYSAWGIIEAADMAVRAHQPNTKEQLEAFALASQEALAATDNVTSLHKAWEAMDAAVTAWADMAGLIRRKAV
jgi:hypothetical protein